jgi:hypothetical protein
MAARLRGKARMGGAVGPRKRTPSLHQYPGMGERVASYRTRSRHQYPKDVERVASYRTRSHHQYPKDGGVCGLVQGALPPSRSATTITACLTGAALMVVREKASLAGRASRFPFLCISIAVVVLSLAAALAGLIPARQAASIDPMEALRSD